jgi:hypothetical protein
VKGRRREGSCRSSEGDVKAHADLRRMKSIASAFALLILADCGGQPFTVDTGSAPAAEPADSGAASGGADGALGSAGAGGSAGASGAVASGGASRGSGGSFHGSGGSFQATGGSSQAVGGAGGQGGPCDGGPEVTHSNGVGAALALTRTALLIRFGFDGPGSSSDRHEGARERRRLAEIKQRLKERLD